MGSLPLPNMQLLEIHNRFSEPLAWLDVSEYIEQKSTASVSSYRTRHLTSIAQKLASNASWITKSFQGISRVFQYGWVHTPRPFRATVYYNLVRLSRWLYSRPSSDRIYPLPFNMYLRVGSGDWAPKHQAEAETLRLVEKHTQIPAPRIIDTVEYAGSSFLLMTALRGEVIGRMIYIMTDEQLDLARQDMMKYICELRLIPKNIGLGYKICNALGGGIQDWRIGDSQREELRFEDVSQFKQYLADDLPLNEETRELILALKDVKYDTVFTHADLNLRNILVDENGKISGIVDWECAGWYPEYWEYTKTHFGVRYTVRWIVDVIDLIFPGYREELRVEDTLVSMAPSW